MKVTVDIPNEFIPAIIDAAEYDERTIENFIARSTIDMALCSYEGQDCEGELDRAGQENLVALRKRQGLFEAKIDFEGREATAAKQN